MNKENLTAYEVVTEENLTDIHSTGWLLRHKKTGVSVIYLSFPVTLSVTVCYLYLTIPKFTFMALHR